MIIDARNVNLGITPKNYNNQAPASMTKEDSKRITGLLDEGVDAYFNIKNVPVKSEAASAKTDSLDTSGAIDVSKVKMVRLLRNYEQDYTAYDALNNTWFASTEKNCFALYKSCSSVGDPAVSDMSKGEFLDYVRENGLDKTISWEGVRKNLTGTIDYKNFSQFTDYSAALFAGLESRIKSDFAGEEQTEQLEMLKGVFESAAKDFAGQIIEQTKTAFENSGQELSADKLEKSIAEIINGKKEAYSDFMRRNKDYAGVENTEDSWLKRDLGFMTYELRKAFAAENAGQVPENVQQVPETDEELFSENDIIAIGMASQLFGEDDLYRQACAIMQNKDEEYVGMAVAMKWLAAEKITVELGVSDSVKGLVGGLLEKYSKDYMDAVDNALAKFSKNPMETTADSFPPLDRRAVNEVVEVMKKSYAKSGDEKKAIIDTAAFARSAYLEKAKKSEFANIWRYNCSSKLARSRYSKEFWEGFYDSDTKSSHSGGMKKILGAWDKFAETVENKDLYSFTFSANTFRSYGANTFIGKIYGGVRKN